MRRAIARGRMFPQSRSTDPRMGRVNVTRYTRYMRYMVQKIAQKKGVKLPTLKLKCNSYETVTIYILHHTTYY